MTSLDRFLKKKVAIFTGCDCEDVEYPVVGVQAKLKVEFETVEELAAFIKKEFRNMFHFGRGRLFVVGNHYPCTMNLSAILSYNKESVTKELEAYALGGDISTVESISEWIKDNPVKLLYSDDSRVGMVGDFTLDVTDPDHYYEKLKSLCGDEAIKCAIE